MTCTRASSIKKTILKKNRGNLTRNRIDIAHLHIMKFQSRLNFPSSAGAGELLFSIAITTDYNFFTVVVFEM